MIFTEWADSGPQFVDSMQTTTTSDALAIDARSVVSYGRLVMAAHAPLAD